MEAEVAEPTSGSDPGLGCDSELQGYIGHLIRRAQQRHAAAWKSMVSAHTSSVQYAVLVVIDAAGQASQRELCDEIDLDRSTIADVVTRMERRGLLARHRAHGDARRNVVTLTVQGACERRNLRPLVETLQEELVRRMSSEQSATLRDGLRQLLA